MSHDVSQYAAPSPRSDAGAAPQDPEGLGAPRFSLVSIISGNTHGNSIEQNKVFFVLVFGLSCFPRFIIVVAIGNEAALTPAPVTNQLLPYSGVVVTDQRPRLSQIVH